MDAMYLILLEPHEAQIQSLLTAGAGSERSAYMLFGIADIECDPWSNQPRRRLVSHRFDPVGDNELVSASGRHVTSQTDGFMRRLNEAKTTGLTPALVHTHPKGKARFSEQDDRNEAELARTALLKGMQGLVSIVITENELAARIWTTTENAVKIGRILHSGPRLRISGLTGTPAKFLDRRVRLFGNDASRQVSGFRCGIAGGGATGSGVLPLLLRFGAKDENGSGRCRSRGLRVHHEGHVMQSDNHRHANISHKLAYGFLMTRVAACLEFPIDGFTDEAKFLFITRPLRA